MGTSIRYFSWTAHAKIVCDAVVASTAPWSRIRTAREYTDEASRSCCTQHLGQLLQNNTESFRVLPCTPQPARTSSESPSTPTTTAASASLCFVSLALQGALPRHALPWIGNASKRNLGYQHRSSSARANRMLCEAADRRPEQLAWVQWSLKAG